MKFMRQFGIILGVTLAGELLRYAIPLPVPASIYGLMIMLVALEKNIIPLEMVKENGTFLIEIMPLMFIPAAVGLLVSWKALTDICIPVALITVFSTVIVMAVTGKVTQHIIKLEKGSRD